MDPWQLLFWLSFAALVVAATFGVMAVGYAASSVGLVAFVQLGRTTPASARGARGRRLAR